MWSGDSIVQTPLFTVSSKYDRETRVKCVQQRGGLLNLFGSNLINVDNCFKEMFGDTIFDALLTKLFNINTQQLMNGSRECRTGQGMLSTF